MARPVRPPKVSPGLQAAAILEKDLLATIESTCGRLPRLRGDWPAIAIACANVAIAATFSQEHQRNDEGARWLRDYVEAQARDMLDSIAKHGLHNPPNPF